MKRQVLWVLLALAVTFVAGAYAQTLETITVNIPYAFTVSGKQLPAGRYTIERTGMTGSILTIRSEDGKNAVQADYLTRIGGGEVNVPSDAKVVFDKYQDNRYVLSEVYFPGEDGFLLVGATKTAHKHETVKATRKAA